jgi:hypothetical protein
VDVTETSALSSTGTGFECGAVRGQHWSRWLHSRAQAGQPDDGRGGSALLQAIDEVAGASRSGAMSPKDIPINVVVRDGNTLITNTRSAQALTRAGIPRESWNVINRTGDSLYDRLLSGRSGRNGLGSGGLICREWCEQRQLVRHEAPDRPALAAPSAYSEVAESAQQLVDWLRQSASAFCSVDPASSLPQTRVGCSRRPMRTLLMRQTQSRLHCPGAS